MHSTPPSLYLSLSPALTQPRQNAACADARMHDACAVNPADWTERAISGNQVSVHRETTYVPSPGRARPRDRTNHHTCNVPAAHGTLHVRSLNSERQRPAYPIGHGHRAARAPHPQVARAAHAKTPQNHVHPPSPTGAIGVAASACETARKYVRALGSRGGGEWIVAHAPAPAHATRDSGFIRTREERQQQVVRGLGAGSMLAVPRAMPAVRCGRRATDMGYGGHVRAGLESPGRRVCTCPAHLWPSPSIHRSGERVLRVMHIFLSHGVAN